MEMNLNVTDSMLDLLEESVVNTSAVSSEDDEIG